MDNNLRTKSTSLIFDFYFFKPAKTLKILGLKRVNRLVLNKYINPYAFNKFEILSSIQKKKIIKKKLILTYKY